MEGTRTSTCFLTLRKQFLASSRDILIRCMVRDRSGWPQHQIVRPSEDILMRTCENLLHPTGLSSGRFDVVHTVADQSQKLKGASAESASRTMRSRLGERKDQQPRSIRSISLLFPVQRECASCVNCPLGRNRSWLAQLNRRLPLPSPKNISLEPVFRRSKA